MNYLLRNLRFTILLLALFATACQPLQPTSMPMADESDASSGEMAGEHTPIDLDDALPLDPNVRLGTLDNGLVYYIRYNTEPMNRAELWLAVNAGSLQEDEDQLGLAHFLEHMLFEGTRRFEGHAILDFLESVGLEFGPDANAYTSFDETVYNLQIPTDDPEVVGTAFDILEDWAAYATISPEEVDKERGIIVEEWRLRTQSASGRIQEQTLPIWLGDSRYTDRLPIGDMEIVNNAPAETLRRFYETWYRPDLMALIAVGDFDVDEIEGLIEEHFSSLSMPEDPVARPSFDVPEHEETRYAVITDPEQTDTRIQIVYKRPASTILTGSDIRDSLESQLFYTMLNQRFEEISREPDAAFLFAFAGETDFVRPLDADFIVSQVADDSVEAGLDAIMVEVERARRHGFTETELDRAKIDVLRRFEVAYNERENIDHGSYASEYLTHYFTGQAAPGIAVEFDLAQQLLPEIAVDEVNQKVADLIAGDNRAVVVIAPEKEEVALPSEADLATIIDSVQARTIDAYEDEVVDSELIAEVPEPAEVTAESSIPELDVTEIELANGIRVIMKPTDFKDDEVVFTAVSPGGSSLVPDDDFAEADNIISIITESGVGNFDQTALGKALAGKAVSVSPYIGELDEGFSGSASPDDLETLFQLIHLYVTAPRADETAFEVFLNQQRAFLTNRALSPDAALQDALIDALYGDTVRRGQLPLEEIEAIDLARGFEIYQDRFADVGDFTFIFVGSFDVAELSALAQTYLGTLPASGRDEMGLDVSPEPPDTVVEETVFKGQDERSITQIVFSGPIERTDKNELSLSALQGVLDILLREDLREDRGGVYSSGVFSVVRERPDPTYFVVVSFGSDPDRVDELVGAVFDQIDALQAEGPSAENVEKVKAQALSSHEENLESNNFWASVLEEYATYPDDDVLDILDFETLVDSLNAGDIQQAAQDYLLGERYVKVVLYPEGFEVESE